MHIAICDDSPAIQQRLSSIIADWGRSREIQIDVFCYSSAEAFLVAWPDVSFDAAILDIEMKGMSGIDLAGYIRKNDKNMIIIFVTSFTQYVLKSFDVHAFHYLIKPPSAAKLFPILDNVHSRWNSNNRAVMLVSNGEGKIKLPFDDIYYIAMQSHKALIQTENDTYDLRKTAKDLSILLPSNFISCHRSYIVNLFKVDCVYKKSLLMSNGESLPISRNRTKIVNDTFIRLFTGT